MIVGAINGGLMPVFGLLLGNVIGVLGKFDNFKDPNY